jgi:hypothetical protein
MPNARYAFFAMRNPILPSPIIPSVCPRGLWDVIVARLWQSKNCSLLHDRAAWVTHVSSRKVDRMPNIAKSATASVEAEALLQ